MTVFDEENKNLISSCKFFSILFRSANPEWIRDPESGSAIRKNAGSGSVSGSALNQCGSETLVSHLSFDFMSGTFMILYLAGYRREKGVEIRANSNLGRLTIVKLPTPCSYVYLCMVPNLPGEFKCPNNHSV